MNKLTANERAAAKATADKLFMGFSWLTTPPGYAYWNDVHENLLGLTKCFDTSVWINEGLPEGWDTVLGYLAKNRPDFFDRLSPEEVCKAVARDGFWLMHRCRERGIPKVTVPAPKAAKEQFGSHRIYPVGLLAERLG